MPERLDPWIEALRPRGGPLVDAAEAFLRWQGAAQFPPGAEGVRRLAALLLAFGRMENASPADDDRFVEGAGALLGLLLVHHAGEGAHRHDGDRHGVALGPHGYFDPFAAIEAALDAEDPRAELARRVREAEAEAEGRGPVARVVVAFRRALERARPELEITRARGLKLALGDDVEVDLAKVARATDGEPIGAVEAAVEKLVAMLPGGVAEEALGWEEARARLLPRLVGARFFDELGARLGGRGRLHGRPLGHGVQVALALAYPGRSRYVRAEELERWSVDPAEAEALAVARLAARSEAARFAAITTSAGPLVFARSGDGLDAARLLLPGLAGVLASALEGPLLAAVPHRDALFACGGGPAVREALRARASDDYARAPHAISDRLFEVHPDGPRPIPPEMPPDRHE
jgi:hypothetical protein